MCIKTSTIEQKYELKTCPEAANALYSVHLRTVRCLLACRMVVAMSSRRSESESGWTARRGQPMLERAVCAWPGDVETMKLQKRARQLDYDTIWPETLCHQQRHFSQYNFNRKIGLRQHLATHRTLSVS